MVKVYRVSCLTYMQRSTGSREIAVNVFEALVRR